MDAQQTSLYPQLTLVAAVSASHMSMPNHWLPYSLVARAHGWSLRFALGLTFLGALGHVSSTLFIMLVISELGSTLVSDSLYRFLSTSVLLMGGCYYLYTYVVAHRRDSCCDSSGTPSKHRANVSLLPTPSPQTCDAVSVHRTAAMSLVLLTTLSPCVGSMPVLLAVLAPPLRTGTVLAAGAVLLVSAAGVMMALVAVSFLGAASLDFARIRRHERLILGLGLISLALLTFFVFSNHDHHHHSNGHEHGLGGPITREHYSQDDSVNRYHEHRHQNDSDGDRKLSSQDHSHAHHRPSTASRHVQADAPGRGDENMH